jgi:hypothetical protein
LNGCAITGALVPAWPAACMAASAAVCTAAPAAPGDSSAQGRLASASVTTAALPRTADGGARRPTPRPTATATMSTTASAKNASTDGFRKKGAGASAKYSLLAPPPPAAPAAPPLPPAPPLLTASDAAEESAAGIRAALDAGMTAGEGARVQG